MDVKKKAERRREAEAKRKAILEAEAIRNKTLAPKVPVKYRDQDFLNSMIMSQLI